MADEAYATFAACHLSSLVESASLGTTLQIHLIDLSLAPSTREQLRGLVPPPHDLRISAPTLPISEGDTPPLLDDPHYIRLLLPHLQTGGERLIYFDVDTIILRDLADLYQTPLESHPVGACVDSLQTVGRAIPNCDELQINQQQLYFNSGVMLIHIDSWKKMEIMGNVCEICHHNATHLIAEGRWPQHDQYGLNVALTSRWQILSPRWNHFSFISTSASTAVIHYLGNSKPWEPACHPTCREIFVDILRRLPAPFLKKLRPAGLAQLIRE